MRNANARSRQRQPEQTAPSSFGDCWRQIVAYITTPEEDRRRAAQQEESRRRQVAQQEESRRRQAARQVDRILAAQQEADRLYVAQQQVQQEAAQRAAQQEADCLRAEQEAERFRATQQVARPQVFPISSSSDIQMTPAQVDQEERDLFGDAFPDRNSLTRDPFQEDERFPRSTTSVPLNQRSSQYAQSLPLQ